MSRVDAFDVVVTSVGSKVGATASKTHAFRARSWAFPEGRAKAPTLYRMAAGHADRLRKAINPS